MQQQPNTISVSRRALVAEAWNRGLLSYKLHAGQQLIYDRLQQLPPNVRQACFICGRRWGKSYLTLVLAIEACLRKPGARILLCAPYIKQASEIAGPLMAKVTEDAPLGLLKRHRSSHRWNFSNGSTLILSGMDLVADTIRGQEFDDVYLEESRDAAPDAFLYNLNSVLLPTLLSSRGRIFHVTSLPSIEDHPLATTIIPRADAQGALFSFPTTECPLYEPAQLQEMCTEVGGPDSVAWSVEFLCQPKRDGSRVAVPEFDGSQVREFELPTKYNMWVAGDWGGVRDRTAFLLMAYDFERAKTLVIDERAFDRHTPTRSIVAAVREMEQQWCAGSPSRYVDCPGQLQVDLGREHQFYTSLPKKEDFEASVNLVRMSMPRLEIHPRCTSLAGTLRYARLNKMRTDFERSPEWGHADALMALCYGLRHTNRDNPYPANWGLHSEHNYIQPRDPHAAASDTVRNLARALLPGRRA